MSEQIKIETVVDSERGCGWRKEGGLYLRSSGVMAPCGKLPVPLAVCPCCHGGIKPAGGWTWIDPRPFLQDRPCHQADEVCGLCPMNWPPPRVGLLWVGEKFYPKPADWLTEAAKLGVSRRIPRVPEGFKVGEHWVFMAHRLAISQACACGGNPPQGESCDTCKGTGTVNVPGIFHAFKPDRIEYVTTGKESAEAIEAFRKRGITPVKVIRDVDLPQGKPDVAAEGEALAIEEGQP